MIWALLFVYLQPENRFGDNWEIKQVTLFETQQECEIVANSLNNSNDYDKGKLYCQEKE